MTDLSMNRPYFEMVPFISKLQLRMKETEVVETGKEPFIDRVAWGMTARGGGKMTPSKIVTLDS